LLYTALARERTAHQPLTKANRNQAEGACDEREHNKDAAR
jgi:hypothetical protein